MALRWEEAETAFWDPTPGGPAPVADTPEVFGTALGDRSKGAQLLSAIPVGQAQGCAAKQQGRMVAAAGHGSFRFSTESSAALAIASSET